MNRRIDSLRTKLYESFLDGIFLHQRENIFYFTGFSGDTAGLYITADDCVLVVDSRFTQQAKEETAGIRGITVAEKDRNWEIRDFLNKEDAIGYEEDILTVEFFGELKKQTEPCELKPAAALPKALRMLKDEEELKNIKKACEIADSAFYHILSYIKEGVSELDIATELDFFMRGEGASGVSFDTIVACGARSALPHGVASDAPIVAHEPVLMDFGCIYNHYCSDITRTVFLGDPGEEARALYSFVSEGQKRGYAGSRTSAPVSDAEENVRYFFAQQDMDRYFSHSLGHGVGLEIHEEPFVNKRNKEQKFQNGMVYTIEPGIYLPGEGGIRIEDTVLMTYFGPQQLTKAPKNLMIL